MICEYGTELREYEVQYIRVASFDSDIIVENSTIQHNTK